MGGVPTAQPEAPDGLTVCPFLGLDRDPTTWFDFPAPGNVCHAKSGQQAGMIRAIGRRVPGSRRRQSISIAHQGATCLAAAHVDCQRYAAAEGASRTAIQARAAAIQPAVPPSLSVVTPDPGEERSMPAMATVAARPEWPFALADQPWVEAPKTRRAKRPR